MRKFAPLLVTVLAVLLTVVAPAFSAGGFGSAAEASGGPTSPPPSGATTVRAGGLLWLGQHCNDYDEDSDVWDKCKATEDALQSDGSLGCSDMFYTPTNPDDSSDKLDVWYTQTDAYADCYVKAQQKLNFIKNSSDCASMVHDSPNWNTCDDAEDALNSSVGCENDDENGGMFKRDGDHWVLNQDSIKKCQAKINAVGALTLKTPPWLSSTKSTKQNAIDLGLLDKDGNPTGKTVADSGSGSTGTGDDEEQLQCESSSFGLGWIICGVIDMLTNVVEAVDGIITNLLEVNNNKIFCMSGDTCEAYYTAWQSFRNIALGLMVVMVLLAVISEALSMDILDAYTIRKALPRVLIAGVAITLSWSLMQFAVQVSNDLGFGIRHLIYAPFASLHGAIDITFQGGFATLFFGTVGYLLVGAAGILAYVGTALLAVGVAVVVLILRQILITLLIILAPVAIVLYILPNTQKYYKIWWESFIKALLMFPLIAGMIAAGRVFSAIALSQGGSLGIGQLIGFVSYFAPYFMIPLTFKMSGAAMGALGGAIQGRADGGFSFLKKKRGAIMQDRLARARSKGIYKGNGRVARALNALGRYTLDFDEQAVVDLGSGKRLGRPLRRLGKRNPLAGRAAKLGSDIAHATSEQTVKAAQKHNMHYTAAWAALGMVDRFKPGTIDSRGMEKLQERYGIKDENGNFTGQYRAVRDNDYADTMAMAEILEEHGIDGSDAQHGGRELAAHAGALSRLQLDSETHRATTTGVAALIASSEGKMTTAEIAQRHTDTVGDSTDPVVRQVAEAEMKQLQKAAAGNNQAARDGKGIRYKQDGTAVSVWDGIEQPDGSIMFDENAATALMTVKDAQVAQGKGEYFSETRKATLFFGNERGPDGELTDRAKQIRAQLVKQAGMWGGNDPGAKLQIDETLKGLGMDPEAVTQRVYENPSANPSAAAAATDPSDGDKARRAAEQAARQAQRPPNEPPGYGGGPASFGGGPPTFGGPA